MPLRWYFLSVGGVLLALLFAADALLPKPSVIGIVSGAAPSPIRIQSQRKGPDAIVFDTTQPTITPSTAVSPEATVTDASPSWSAVRKSFAQVVPTRPAQTAGYERRKTGARYPRKRGAAVARIRRPARVTEYARFDFFRMTW